MSERVVSVTAIFDSDGIRLVGLALAGKSQVSYRRTENGPLVSAVLPA